MHLSPGQAACTAILPGTTIRHTQVVWASLRRRVFRTCRWARPATSSAVVSSKVLVAFRGRGGAEYAGGAPASHEGRQWSVVYSVASNPLTLSFEVTRDRARAFSGLKYYEPRHVLVQLRNTELAIARRTDLPDAVKHLRTQELKHLRELREACLFCYGWSQIDGQSFDVAHAEAQDYDTVASWRSDDHLHFAPIQIKEVVPANLNRHTSVQAIVNKLSRYVDSADLTVVIHLNRSTPFSPATLVVPPLKIAALWVFGALNAEQTRWAIWGNFLETLRWGEFAYPEQ